MDRHSTWRTERLPPRWVCATVAVTCLVLILAGPAAANPFSLDSFRNVNSPLFASRAQTAHPSVVRVVAEERVGTSNGSGTLVDVRGDYGLVVTNWHVVRDSTGEISVLFPDGFRSSARILKIDKDWDLAALLILKPNAAPMKLAVQAPRPGEPLTIAGYGKGDYRAAAGRCMQYVSPGTNHPYEMLEVSVQARNGDSGGPILNERGELAGVLFGAGSGTTSGSFCGRVRWFLESVWPGVGQNAEVPTGLAAAPSNPLAAPAAIWGAPGTAHPASGASNASHGSSPAELVDVESPAAPRGIPDSGTRGGLVSQRRESPAEFEAPGAGYGTSGPMAQTPRQIPYYASPPVRDRQDAATPPTSIGSGFALRDLMGTNPLEQGKLVLAIIGCLALLSKIAGAVSTE